MAEYRVLKAAIKGHSMYQVAFSEKVGRSESFVSHVIKGRRTLSAEEKAKWADVLEVPVSKLFRPKE
jgi:transcriptional regulator with XRE-family HTH domain